MQCASYGFSGERPSSMTRWLGLAVAAALLGACGGGGGGRAAPADASSPPTASLAQHCSPNNPWRADASVTPRAGSLADEKRWLRSYFNDAYLWYGEVPIVDATAAAYSADTSAGFYPSIDAYFEALESPVFTASGKRKDAFSFTYPTRQWRELSQSGIVLGYGIEFTFGSVTPPRDIRIAYIETGSPAAAAGLQRGDTLLSANGVSADVATQAEIDVLQAALFPTAAVSSSLRFSRAGSVLPVLSLAAAAVVKQPVLVAKVLDVGGAKVGYLLFNDHLATAEAPLIAAVNGFKLAGISDLVLDVRYNGGGYLYIASQLAAMIAGTERTTGKVFERLQYSDKRSADSSSADAATPFYDTSCDLDAAFSCTTSAPLPTLGLARVFVLTSGSTCSASESIVNGLRGVDVDVRLVGSQTCGKPYGFTAKDNCGISYFPIEFKGVNAKGFGDYADGLAAECGAADDLGKPLGDIAEGQLAVALQWRASGTCAAPVASRLAVRGATAEAALRRGPLRENRIVLPLAR